MKNEKLRYSNFVQKNSAWLIFFAYWIMVVPGLFIGCEYYNKSDVNYNAITIDTTGRPTIASISPVSGAIGGVKEITINGSSLGIKNSTDTPWVVIGGVSPIIKEMHDSYITIYRPNLSSDHYDKTIWVNVTDPKMYTVSSSYKYYVQSPGAITGDYSGSSRPLGGVDFDSAGYAYVITNKTLYKTDFTGVSQTTLSNSAALSSNDFNSPPFVLFGPASNNKNLFVAAASQSYLWRVAVFDTPNNRRQPIKLPVPSAVNTIDFDDQGNCYTAGDGNLYTADKSVGDSTAPAFKSISGYAGVTNLVKIRVINGSSPTNKTIYIADSLHVWKGQYSASGTSLTMGSPVVDLVAHPELTGCTISSFEIDANGSIFLCLQRYPNYSLFFVEIDGSITPFYKDPNILPKTVDKLIWGNGNYLYLMSSTLQSAPGTYVAGRVYRMTLDRNGALYGGRKFAH